jgi:hypothetical protein
MKLGIKIAPGNDWKSNIESTRPQMVEIWYNANRPDDYDGIFAYLRNIPIDVGLHFWGALPDHILATIAYPDPDINNASLALIRATIDVAANNHINYVNMHNDMRVLLTIDPDFVNVSIASKPADSEVCTQLFLSHMTALKKYADDSGVILTTETVPLRETTNWLSARSTAQVINTHQLPMDIPIELSRRGFAIANDFCHTACNFISDDRDAVRNYLFSTTKTLAPATRLIHMGFVIPPYNGTDFHDSLDNAIFDTTDAIPNSTEMVELLKNFIHRDDIWILVEPRGDHIKNYFLARGILKKAEVLTK